MNHNDAAGPFDLDRFIKAQEDEGCYEQALAELRAGEKRSHWMWYVFPQLAGLGDSSTARRYAIRSIEEAAAYLRHPVLGPRLVACCEAVLGVKGRTASEILGWPDDMKLRSCATLFALVSETGPGSGSVFDQVIDTYYQGTRDAMTIRLLGIEPEPEPGGA